MALTQDFDLPNDTPDKQILALLDQHIEFARHKCDRHAGYGMIGHWEPYLRALEWLRRDLWRAGFSR